MKIIMRIGQVFRVFGIISLIVMQTSLVFAGRDYDDKVSKSVERSFKIPETRNFSITNKYGPVIVNNWSKDSIRIEVEITAYGKNYSNARKTLSRVDIDFDESRQYLNVNTVLDRSSGFFAEVWNSIGDYSKTLLSQNRLKVEYKVFVPNDLDIRITNKYGDIYFEDYEGSCTIDLSYGNLMAQRFFNRSDFTISYGTVTIKQLQDANLNLKASDVRIEKAGSVEISSSSSEIEISEASFLRIDSGNDREFRIRSVASLIGKSNFSRIEVDEVYEDINLDMSYGGIILENIDQGFSRISVRGKTTDIQVKMDPTVPVQYRIEGRADKMDIPKQLIDSGKEYNTDGDKIIRIEGSLLGAGKDAAKLDIRNQSGEIKINFN